jgi:hypothetical protein
VTATRRTAICPPPTGSWASPGRFTVTRSGSTSCSSLRTYRRKVITLQLSRPAACRRCQTVAMLDSQPRRQLAAAQRRLPGIT